MSPDCLETGGRALNEATEKALHLLTHPATPRICAEPEGNAAVFFIQSHNLAVTIQARVSILWNFTAAAFVRRKAEAVSVHVGNDLRLVEFETGNTGTSECQRSNS